MKTNNPSPKPPDPKFHPKLMFSQIVLEQRSGIKKSFWGWFKPIYKDNRQFSPNPFWLFGIIHPESNMSKTKTMFVPFPSLREMSSEVTSSGGMFNLQGAVPLPRQTLLDVPQAGGCSWHLPLECQTAFFCGRHKQRRTVRDWKRKRVLEVSALLVVQQQNVCAGQSVCSTYPDKYWPDLDLHFSFPETFCLPLMF